VTPLHYKPETITRPPFSGQKFQEYFIFPRDFFTPLSCNDYNDYNLDTIYPLCGLPPKNGASGSLRRGPRPLTPDNSRVVRGGSGNIEIRAESAYIHSTFTGYESTSYASASTHSPITYARRRPCPRTHNTHNSSTVEDASQSCWGHSWAYGHTRHTHQEIVQQAASWGPYRRR